MYSGETRMTFTFKKQKEGIVNIDLTKVHGTAEVHVMAETKASKCSTCKKVFKDGDKCAVSSVMGKYKVNHIGCEK